MCTSCCKPTAADVLTRTKTGQVMRKEGGTAEGGRQGVVQTGGGGTGERRGEGEKWRGWQSTQLKVQAIPFSYRVKSGAKEAADSRIQRWREVFQHPHTLVMYRIRTQTAASKSNLFYHSQPQPTCTILHVHCSVQVNAGCFSKTIPLYKYKNLVLVVFFLSLFLTMNHLYSYQFCVHIEHSFRSLKSRSTEWSRQPISAQF